MQCNQIFVHKTYSSAIFFFIHDSHPNTLIPFGSFDKLTMRPWKLEFVFSRFDIGSLWKILKNANTNEACRTTLFYETQMYLPTKKNIPLLQKGKKQDVSPKGLIKHPLSVILKVLSPPLPLRRPLHNRAIFKRLISWDAHLPLFGPFLPSPRPFTPLRAPPTSLCFSWDITLPLSVYLHWEYLRLFVLVDIGFVLGLFSWII